MFDNELVGAPREVEGGGQGWPRVCTLALTKQSFNAFYKSIASLEDRCSDYCGQSNKINNWLQELRTHLVMSRLLDDNRPEPCQLRSRAQARASDPRCTPFSDLSMPLNCADWSKLVHIINTSQEGGAPKAAHALAPLYLWGGSLVVEVSGTARSLLWYAVSPPCIMLCAVRWSLVVAPRFTNCYCKLPKSASASKILLIIDKLNFKFRASFCYNCTCTEQ